ncbi:MAG: hypothetical protein MUC78_12055, partial [Bacteroidales bacterium]|nr:hypothetical protein [Bacteroidales bacterium]
MKKSFFLLLLSTLLICLPLQAIAVGENPLPWLGYLNDRRVDSLLNTLTVREMIAQIVWVPAWAGSKNDNYTEVEELVKKHGIGGVIFFEGELERQADFTKRISSVSKLPLIFVMDAEWGT